MCVYRGSGEGHSPQPPADDNVESEAAEPGESTGDVDVNGTKYEDELKAVQVGRQGT